MVIILLMAVGLASFLGYRSWARRAKTPRILVERDQSDVTLNGSQAQGKYDPYFNRVNLFDLSVVASRTNVSSGSNQRR